MADEICSDEREKSLYLTQIRHLDEKLERFQLRCDELEKQNKNLVIQCKALEDADSDRGFLERVVAEKEKEVEELAVKLETQQQVTEQTLEELKLQQSLELKELQEQVDELRAQIREQDARFEEQRLQKEQLEQQLCGFEPLKEKLRSKEAEHKTAVEGLKRDIESEMDSMIHERREKLRLLSDTKISEIVQEEMAEMKEMEQQTVEVVNRIQHQREERTAIDTKRSKLLLEIGELKAAAAGLEESISTVETETEKLTEMTEWLQKKIKNQVRVHEDLVAQTDKLRKQLNSAVEENCQKTKMAAQLNAALQEEKTRQAVLENDVKKAVIVLRHILEAPGEAVRTLLNQDLLKILERNLPEAEESTLRDSIETRSGAPKPQTSEPGSERAEAQNLATDPLFLLARFRPGDFGLIPRPTWKP
ncbi:uncharacterized protein LOC141790024 [Halichoeres trimaculatus]|uniref:uncharacterized protein LOC141790024 n=1 Tax=Halichoeres trimaculatus TaxID=147232 RepID=UPI003D9EBDF4